jgi:hypothetical protein
VIAHYRGAADRLPAATTRGDIHSRWLSAILDLDQQRQCAPLCEPREEATRVQGCCRDQSLFCVGVLRQHGMAARSRVGFVCRSRGRTGPALCCRRAAASRRVRHPAFAVRRAADPGAGRSPGSGLKHDLRWCAPLLERTHRPPSQSPILRNHANSETLPRITEVCPTKGGAPGLFATEIGDGPMGRCPPRKHENRDLGRTKNR